MALAITPQGDFGDLPNYGKASKRDLRPWLKSVLIAGENSWRPEAASFNNNDNNKKTKKWSSEQYYYIIRPKNKL